MDRHWARGVMVLGLAMAIWCGDGARALDVSPADGVSDVWAAHFGVTNLAPGDDPDMDDQDNLFESAAGTDPWDRYSRFQTMAQGGPPGSQTNIVVSWFGVPGKRYEVLASHDLLSWELFDGPFTGAGADLSVPDTILYPSGGDGMMALGEPSEEQKLIESLDPQPSWWPRSATTDSDGKATIYNFQFVCVSVFDNGLCSMTLFDGDQQFRILSNLPIGRHPATQIWQDRPSGWGAFFLEHADSWDSYVRFYEIADADKLVAGLLGSKTAAYCWEPFPRSYYTEPCGWVLELFEWMHDYYEANREYFAAGEAAAKAGTYEVFAMETAPALASLEGGGTMSLDGGATDQTRRFYRVQTIPSLDGDQDMLNAAEEALLGTSDAARDSDADGMPDAYEFGSGLNPAVDDSGGNRDGDGAANDEDARPDDAGVGRLAITISSPGGGATVP